LDQAQDTDTPPLLTRSQRSAAGKALRAVVSRESLADFTVDPHRDPMPLLTAGDASRVQALVPERYKRMAVSPFTFYRGAAAVMAHDASTMPRLGLSVQACGDCHLMNFGAFSSPEGTVLFDINDFDETAPGVDFTVDLKRLVASVAVAAQDAQVPDKKAQALAKATAKAYRDFMSYLAELSPLDVWQTRMDLQDQLNGLGDSDLETKILSKLVKSEKGGKTSSEQPGIEIGPDGAPSFTDKSPFIYHVGVDGHQVNTVLNAHALALYKSTLQSERAVLLDKYALRDVAFKVVGVGSVGTYCAIGLMETADGESIILQLKQAQESAIAQLSNAGSGTGHQGKRVVDGQRAMQAASDIFLGWTQDDDGRQFYMRQLKNRRLGSIGEAIEGKALAAYATLCGRTLARAHARTGDPAMISGYLGGSEVSDEALATFAMSYASQTVLDHAKLVASGLVPHDTPVPSKPAKTLQATAAA
jgi:uncharacterized protein (DUF2252 family)